MASFRFLDSEGNAVDLCKVDEHICKVFDMTPDEKRVSRIYDQAVDFGFSVLMNGGSHVTPELLDVWFDSTPGRKGLRNDSDVLKLTGFLDGTFYTFDAWR